MRIKSFKSQLLLTLLAGYIVLWVIFFAVVFLNFRNDTTRLLDAQRDWLTLYTGTFLNDLQIGNSLAVERKLENLVNKEVFDEARLTFGSNEIFTHGINHSHQELSPFLKWLLPSSNIKISVRDDSNSEWGILEATMDTNFLTQPVQQSISQFLQFSGALFFFMLAILLWLIDKQASPLESLMNYFRRFSGGRNEPNEINQLLEEELHLDVVELKHLSEEFKKTVRNILDLQDQIRKQRLQSEASKIAAQVAHDIRSPLSALSLATSDIQSVPEEKRVLIRAAVNRINDIANELLEKYRSLTTQEAGSKEDSKATKLSLELIPSLVDSVLSEKRSQFKTRKGLNFDTKVDTNSYGLFGMVNPIQFKRIISNLINNSVDAIEGSGQIEVSYATTPNWITLSVKDNGKGIPSELLPKILVEAKSHGKKEGMGMGLPHANRCVREWNGTMSVKSKAGKGTHVEIRLPRENPPAWFIPALKIKPSQTVIVLDDDVAIHLVWQSMFTEVCAEHNIQLLHFSYARELVDWHNRHQELSKKVFHLVDYELIGSDHTGLEIIRNLGIAKQSVLVTSLFEDKRIREAAAEIGVGFIPKTMASHVPIEVTTQASEPKYILIDDEELVHLTWKSSARTEGKALDTYFTPEDFYAVLGDQDLDSEIYIDRNLGSGVNGEDVARILHNRGFKNIFLATGMEKEDLPELPYISGIISKSPPWTQAPRVTH